MKVTPVEEVSYGVYIWSTSDGKLVSDEEGNFMCIYANKGDANKIAELRRFAKDYGVEDGGKPVWFSGHRPVSQEEYELQKQRMDWGLVADEWDIPALKEDLVQKKKMGLL